MVSNESESLSDAALIAQAEKFLALDRDKGNRDNVMYRVETEDGIPLVVMQENQLLGDNMGTLFRYTLIFLGAAMVVLFFFSNAFAKRLISPLRRTTRSRSSSSPTPPRAQDPHRRGERQRRGALPGDRRKPLAGQHPLGKRADGGAGAAAAGAGRAEIFPVVREKVDLSRVVTGCTLPFEGVAFDRGRELDYDISPDLFVWGDPNQLGHLVTVFLDNAMEHSSPDRRHPRHPEGEKHTVAWRCPTPETPSPRAALGHLERFYRADEARNSSSSRYGLGLAIAKAIALAHKGKIGVDCADGRTEFWVTFPAWSAR